MGRGRASKKLIIHQDKLPSSVYAVVSNDDLLIEILVRLPAFSILVFKTVSKRWLSLITGHVSTIWCSQNPNVDPPCGLFLQRCVAYDRIYNYVALDTRFLVNRSLPLIMNATNRFGFPYNGKAEILQSCNGLLLCTRSSDKFYVYNPVIKQYKMLPPCCNYSTYYTLRDSMRLAFDHIKSPYYKIIFAGTKHDYDDYIQIQTYSSETGTWSICPDQFLKSDFSLFHHAIYWNNALHWICDGKKHVKLDVERLVLTTVQTLHALGRCKLFESRGCLLLVGEYTDHTDDTQHLAIYEMRKGSSRWSLKYLVNRDDIMNLFTKRTGVQPAISRMGCYHVQCIVLGEKEKDSFLVLERRGIVVQYKIESKTMRGLYDGGPESLHTALYRGCYQLYASFASV